MLSPLLIAELACLGLFTGFLAGLLGIGGGMLMVPFITYFLGQQGVQPELAIKMAIATSMATIVFTSISSVRAHHLRGAVRWDLVWRLAPGIVLGGMLASLGVFALLRGAWLAVFFGFSLLLRRCRCFWTANRQRHARCRALPGRWLPAAPSVLFRGWWARAAASSVCPS